MKVRKNIDLFLESKKNRKDEIEILKTLENEYFAEKTVSEYLRLRELDFCQK